MFFQTIRIKQMFPVLILILFILSALLPGITGPAVAAEPEDTEEKKPETASTFIEAFTKGSFDLGFRYRYENVSDDTPGVSDKDAHASTLRTALGYRTLPYYGVSGLLEFENVTPIGAQLYNNKGYGDLGNGVTDRPVVADPKITEVNQALVSITSIPETTLNAGREEILLDNQRFVGNVGWRQNHQSFDGVSLKNTSLSRTTLTYVFIGNVNRIFGDNKPMSSHLLNAGLKWSDAVNVTGYGYILDYDRTDDAGASTRTFGGRFHGKKPLGEEGWAIRYELEYALQNDNGDNPADIDADYMHAAFGGGPGPLLMMDLGYEVLGGSPEDGSFSTPLATLHKFNGWADRFLGTPANGLEDLHLSVTSAPKPFTFKAIYHWFRADTGGEKYGNELDLLATYKSPWKQLFGLKAALYDAKTYSYDTQKIMFFTQITF